MHGSEGTCSVTDQRSITTCHDGVKTNTMKFHRRERRPDPDSEAAAPP